MDFGVLVNDLNSTWAFVLAGLLLPAASVAITLLFYRRLLRQFGIGKLTHPDRAPDQKWDAPCVLLCDQPRNTNRCRPMWPKAACSWLVTHVSRLRVSSTPKNARHPAAATVTAVR